MSTESHRSTDPDAAPEQGQDQVFDNRDSNPNGGGEQGLAGGMGVSSERTGPEGADPRSGSPVSGTGSKGGSVTGTDGGFDTSPVTPTGAEIDE